jgi:pullulanase/glycogen debranching enzyme
MGMRQLCHDPRRIHPERSRYLQRQTQRSQRRGQQGRQQRQSIVELRRRRTHGRPGDQHAAESVRSAICWRPCCSRRARPCCSPAMNSARTQKGNNNAYCQDNEVSWLDWNLSDKGQSLVQFVQSLCALAQQISDPAQKSLFDRQRRSGTGGQRPHLDQRIGQRNDRRRMGRHRNEVFRHADGWASPAHRRAPARHRSRHAHGAQLAL